MDGAALNIRSFKIFVSVESGTKMRQRIAAKILPELANRVAYCVILCENVEPAIGGRTAEYKQLIFSTSS
jgi:hypothetical protein